MRVPMWRVFVVSWRRESAVSDLRDARKIDARLQELANAISSRADSVTRIVDESREICSHTSGSEATAMTARIDRLHTRYNQVLDESLRRIEKFATAIRVSEDLAELVEQTEEFLDACDDALAALDDTDVDEQLESIGRLDEELNANAHFVDEVERSAVLLDATASL